MQISQAQDLLASWDQGLCQSNFSCQVTRHMQSMRMTMIAVIMIDLITVVAF